MNQTAHHAALQSVNLDGPQLAAIADASIEAPLLLVSVSGAHLYGFASPDSDVDLRGTHLESLPNLLGLDPANPTLDRSWEVDGLEIDLVSHDLAKFLTLLLGQNGNYLEQLFSPLVVIESESMEELRTLVQQGTIARHAYQAYAGYAHSRWRIWREAAQDGSARVKPLLYAYRVSLTGLHLLQTGEVNAHLPTLAAEYGFDSLFDLIELKVSEKAAVRLSVDDHDKALQALQDRLLTAYERSPLPPEPTNRAALNDFLLRARLQLRTQ